MTCACCDLGLDHCHGVLVEHDDGTATCLAGCGGPRSVHDEVAACAEIALGCCGEAGVGRGIAGAQLPAAA